MASLQASGAISLANIQGVMGGDNPISLSEYYREGAYVPATQAIYNSSGPVYDAMNNYYLKTLGGKLTIKWGGAIIVSNSPGFPASYTINGYTYYPGTLKSSSGGIFYEVIRAYYTYSAINTNIPSSGGISFSQFFSAQKP